MLKNHKHLLILSLIVVTVFSCLPIKRVNEGKKHFRDGKQYGITDGPFRHKWWNYYERGLSFHEGAFWSEAERDIREAIKKREIDQRRARTYGMHFIDYFPHRELGISLFYLKRHKEAEKELIISLTQEETARAKYYLNKVRKEIVVKEGSEHNPPHIKITTPFNGMMTSDLSIEIGGVVSDEHYVSDISINNSAIFIERAEQTISFSRNIKLDRGKNSIIVLAKDLSGQTVKETVTVFVDRNGPLVSIYSISKKGNSSLIRGTVFDNNGVSSLKMGKKKILGKNSVETSFNVTIPNKEGPFVPFYAIDSVGNITKGTIKLVLQEEAFFDKEIKGSIRLASGGRFSTTDFKRALKHKDLKQDDTTAPFVKLRKGIGKKQTIFEDSFFIEGEASDREGVISLTINGEPLIQRPGKKLFFNYIAELEKGENRFIILAQDSSGNLTKKTVNVERKIPLIHQSTSRITAAILPFREKGSNRELTPLFEDSFLTAIYEKERFNIVARGETFESLLRELKLNTTDLVDKSTVVRLGKLVIAETIVSGSVIETPRYIQMTAHVIDTETSDLMFTTDVYGEDKDLSSFRYLVGGLALKITTQFPMAEGRVIKINGNEIYINLGTDKRMKRNTRYLIYRKTFGDMGSLHELKAKDVYKKMSKTEIVRSFLTVPVKVEDLVITK